MCINNWHYERIYKNYFKITQQDSYSQDQCQNVLLYHLSLSRPTLISHVSDS